jgi:hypothetical protein
MKSFFVFGILFFALTFCGITDRIKQAVDETSETAESTNKAETNSDASESGDGDVAKAELSARHKEILEGGKDVKWDEQGITFTVPSGGWNKMDVKKESFNYGSPGTGFLIGTISPMPDSVPGETSLKAQHTQALEQLKNGKYENVRWLEIDGVKGVEWVEAPAEDKGSPRRHQWIGFRNYQGQNQQVNMMVSTDSGKFDDKKDTFAAILYSMNFD